MTHFALDARVAVVPFAQRQEGSSVTIGDLDRQVFLTIPAEGLDLLNALAAGSTVSEAVRVYERAHAETPDVEGFLAALAAEGFVASWSEDAVNRDVSRTADSAAGTQSHALLRRLFAAPVLGACAFWVGVALVLVATDPGMMPGPTVLVFHHHVAVLAAALFAVNLLGVTLHELAHLLAARAFGVPARIGVSHRLWFLVAETEMTAIWMAPKRARYVAFLAGAILDAVSAAALVGVLWAAGHHWIALSPTLEQFTSAVLVIYLLRILWQCFIFIRTDFYYVLVTALDCANLLSDTEDLLRNVVARLLGSAPVVDQSAIPLAEMRAVRAFSGVWLAGRALALASLIFVTLPVLVGYVSALVAAAEGNQPGSYNTIDLLTLAFIAFGVQGVGLFVWIRSLHRRRTQRRANALAQQ